MNIDYYERTELTITEFEEEDVITTSSIEQDPRDPYEGIALG